MQVLADLDLCWDEIQQDQLQVPHAVLHGPLHAPLKLVIRVHPNTAGACCIDSSDQHNSSFVAGERCPWESAPDTSGSDDKDDEMLTVDAEAGSTRLHIAAEQQQQQEEDEEQQQQQAQCMLPTSDAQTNCSYTLPAAQFEPEQRSVLLDFLNGVFQISVHQQQQHQKHKCLMDEQQQQQQQTSLSSEPLQQHVQPAHQQKDIVLHDRNTCIHAQQQLSQQTTAARTAAAGDVDRQLAVVLVGDRLVIQAVKLLQQHAAAHPQHVHQQACTSQPQVEARSMSPASQDDSDAHRSSALNLENGYQHTDSSSCCPDTSTSTPVRGDAPQPLLHGTDDNGPQAEQPSGLAEAGCVEPSQTSQSFGFSPISGITATPKSVLEFIFHIDDLEPLESLQLKEPSAKVNQLVLELHDGFYTLPDVPVLQVKPSAPHGLMQRQASIKSGQPVPKASVAKQQQFFRWVGV